MRQSGQGSAIKLRLGRALAGGCLALTSPAPPSIAEPAAAPLQTFTIAVPTDYARAAAGTVPLRVGIAHALHSRRGAEPVFVVEALGESSVDAAGRGLIDSLKALRDTHDLVFVDQRGTSLSPLLCPPVSPGAPIAEQAAPIFDADYLRACRESSEHHEDLGDLNSRTFAQDLESVRRKLGYKRIDLIGYFYGTRIVQQYLARWSSRVSAAVLADVSPMDYPAAQSEAGALSGSVASTLQACRADAACSGRYPALDAEWAQIAARLATDRTGLLYWMKLRTLRWPSAASWPRDVDAIATGHLPSVLQQYVAYRRTVLASFPLALRVAVDCAENMPKASLNGAEGPEQQACATWPVHRLARSELRTPRTNVPILAVTAAFDIEAPASAVRRSVASFANAQLLVFPNRARVTDVDWSECMGPLVTTFLQSSGRTRVDTGCVDRLKRPPFVISPGP